MDQDQLTDYVDALTDLMDEGYRDDWRAKTPVWRYDDSTLGADVSAVAARLEVHEDEALRVLRELSQTEIASVIVYEYAPRLLDVIQPFEDAEEVGPDEVCDCDPDARSEADYVDVFEKVASPVDHCPIYARMDCKSPQPEIDPNPMGNFSDWFMDLFSPVAAPVIVVSEDSDKRRRETERRAIEEIMSGARRHKSPQPIKSGRYDMAVNGAITVSGQPFSAAEARIAALMNMLTTKKGV